MANDITNSGNFSFNNMKPDADEEIVALWGQNIADNTGVLYYQNYLACSFSTNLTMLKTQEDWGTFATGTMFFIKQPNANTLHGTFQGNSRSSGFTGGTGIFYVNNIEAVRGTFTLGYSGGEQEFGTGFAVDISSLTDYQHYETSWSFDQKQVDTNSDKYYTISASLWGTSI